MEALEGRQLLGSGRVFKLCFDHLPDADSNLSCEYKRRRHSHRNDGKNLSQIRSCIINSTPRSAIDAATFLIF